MIKVSQLEKKFDSFAAVDKITFAVNKGEVFGLLGPNGAGKTTTIRMLTGILEPTSGSAVIGKFDIQQNPLEAKQLMGIVPEMANAYLDLSAKKNLGLIGGLYGLSNKQIGERIEYLLKMFELYEKRKQKVKTFSKGMKQRLIVAMGLINSPQLLFLDEPTSGLDVKSVRLIRKLIRDFNDQGTTIVLTTHNIDEADQLCDRVAIMNHGKIVAIDRPEKLRQTIQSVASIEVAWEKEIKPTDLNFLGVSKIKKIGDKYKIFTDNPEIIIPQLIEYSTKTGNKILSLNTLAPDLEDVFVKLTEE